jgi:hypothetical protein
LKKTSEISALPTQKISSSRRKKLEETERKVSEGKRKREGGRGRESFASHSEVEALSAERGNLADSYFGALFVCTLFFL